MYSLQIECQLPNLLILKLYWVYTSLSYCASCLSEKSQWETAGISFPQRNCESHWQPGSYKTCLEMKFSVVLTTTLDHQPLTALTLTRQFLTRVGPICLNHSLLSRELPIAPILSCWALFWVVLLVWVISTPWWRLRPPLGSERSSVFPFPWYKIPTSCLSNPSLWFQRQLFNFFFKQIEVACSSFEIISLGEKNEEWGHDCCRYGWGESFVVVTRKKIARGFRLSTARRGDRNRENQETKSGPKVAEVI